MLRSYRSCALICDATRPAVLRDAALVDSSINGILESRIHQITLSIEAHCPYRINMQGKDNR